MLIAHVNLAKGLRGGERQTALLIEALAAQAVQQVLIARRDSPLYAVLEKVQGLSFMPVRKPYIKYLFRGVRADLLHAHEAKAGQWAYCNFLRTGTPYLITRRVPNQQTGHFLNRALYGRAAQVVALSAAIKHQLQDCVSFLQPAIVPSMYAGFGEDATLLQTLRRRYQGKFIIGHVGALVKKHKGQQYLIEVARMLQTDYPHIHFLFLGSGADAVALKTQAAALTNVEFLGQQTALGTYFRLFDVFAFPSLQEGLGSSLLDAMYADCPIVASAVDGILDIVRDTQNGILVPAADAEALRDAILRLYQNPELRARLCAVARQDVQQYAPEVISKRYYQLYESLLKPS